MSPQDVVARADRKLGEAEFFLDKLSQESRRESWIGARAFGYYLSAFLAAARSASALLTTGRYYRWYRQWNAALTKSQPRLARLLAFMTEQRDEEVHGRGASVRIKTKKVDARLVRGMTVFGPPLAAVMAEAERTGQQVDVGSLLAQVDVPEFFFDDGTLTNVLDDCTHYLHLLRQLRNDFGSAHGT